MQAEEVCRAYLPAGHRQGRYWIAGDIHGARGKSLFVRLSGERAGQWMDAATGEHGDLLDLIQLTQGFKTCREAMIEARSFLHEPDPIRASSAGQSARFPNDSIKRAERLHALSSSLPGTLAETYLRRRNITARLDWPSLRFHPACYYRAAFTVSAIMMLQAMMRKSVLPNAAAASASSAASSSRSARISMPISAVCRSRP